jgi:cytochrome c oxidase cbb3-type subunit I/II
MVVALTAYGMATLEGPMLSIKSVNSLSHYTDWTVAHVHGGALGWVGFISAAFIYWIVPRLWNTEWAKPGWLSLHFWIGTVGIIFYIVPMWAGGITQGLMWRALNDLGGLKYAEFLETVRVLQPFYLIRVVGGLMYLAGFILLLVNLLLTVTGPKTGRATQEAA